jgi:hypothetical protein
VTDVKATTDYEPPRIDRRFHVSDPLIGVLNVCISNCDTHL